MTAPYIIISFQLSVSSITYTINLLSESAHTIIVTSATGPIEILSWQLKDGSLALCHHSTICFTIVLISLKRKMLKVFDADLKNMILLEVIHY